MGGAHPYDLPHIDNSRETAGSKALTFLFPQYNGAELFDDPHVQARQVVRPLDGDVGMAPRFPVKFSNGLGDVPATAPVIGQDNGVVLSARGWPCASGPFKDGS